METIGILAAMPQERDAVLRFIKKPERTILGPFRCDRFRLAERDCWLVMSGMGVKRAGEAAGILIKAVIPQFLVSVGVAGAVNPDLEIGDVVVSRATCRLEEGRPGPFQPLALLSDAAWHAAEQTLQKRGARLFSGIAVTTPGSQLVQYQPAEMVNPVLEMETAGIAQVAIEQGIPLLSLRAISDGPRAPIPFDLETMIDKDYNLHTGRLIKTFLSHPQMLSQLMRMGQNTTKAATNASIALIAALNQAGAIIFS